ncbi:hypothetical protein Btru_073089 [Bulinus truncatus]|nr:hypothetical protein Btru_073089 [Bulinus truncatus]
MAIPDDNFRGVQTSDDIVNDIALGPPTGLQETHMIEQLDVELRTTDTSLISHAQTDIAGISTNNADVGTECSIKEWRCNSNHCVASSSRCDGLIDCKDQSDEDNCTECGKKYWLCSSGRCIRNYMICDGVNDCGNFSDEMNCTSCSLSSWRCDNNQCIERHQRCDAYADCIDNSDENNCPKTNSSLNSWMCDNGQYINNLSRCNGRGDCRDGSDEMNCTICAETAWRCNNTRCVLRNLVCDNYDDCGDKSDEDNCGECLESQWKCESGQCIDRHYRCSGKKWFVCRDNSHLENCSDCGGYLWHCNDRRCIPEDNRCDGYKDCMDNSDEKNCVTCTKKQWRCSSGQCIRVQERCDGFKSCVDGSDEVNCTSCSKYRWRCNSGQCIMDEERCDGEINCFDASDEINCASCADDKWQCNSGYCIDLTSRCNGIMNCWDESDEENCDSCTHPGWLCNDGRCIDKVRTCDRIKDCNDGADEENCVTCTGTEWQCFNRRCIHQNKTCNGVDNCGDRSDEIICNDIAVARCEFNDWRCANGQCIYKYNLCDGFKHCKDESDEDNCGACLSFQWTCLSGQCVRGRLRCDGVNDCSDGSDEINCPTRCSDTEWRCNNGQCILLQQLCNGNANCRDGSDEMYCIARITIRGVSVGSASLHKNDVTASHTAMMKVMRENCAPCLPGYLKCNNDKCVANDTRCNGVNDCIDNSDEEYCQLCQPGSWQCDSTRCIKEEYVCNGNNDCVDATDESNCIECGAYRWKCANGTCIALVQLCDGQQDCPDGSDETNCAADISKETVAIVLSVVLAMLAAGLVLVVAVVRQGKLNIKSENNRQPGMDHTDNIEEYLDIDHYDYVSRSNEEDVTFDEENSLDINSENVVIDANRRTTPDGVASVNDLGSASRSRESLTSHAAEQNNDVLHPGYITPLDVYNDINTTVNELKQNDIRPEAQHVGVATKNMDDPDRATSPADERDEQNGERLLHSDYITPVDVIYGDLTPEELKNGKNEPLTQVKQLFKTPVNIDVLATDVYTYTGDKCDDRFHNPIGGLQTEYLTPVDVIYPPGANQTTAIASSDVIKIDETSSQYITPVDVIYPLAGNQLLEMDSPSYPSKSKQLGDGTHREPALKSYYCENFLYFKDSQLCLLGRHLGSAGIKPQTGQHIYSVRTRLCDVSLGYNSTLLTMYGECLYVSNFTANFSVAQTECYNKQGLLVMFKSSSKKNTLMKLLTSLNIPNFWVGLNDIQTESVWVWSDGTLVTTTEMTMVFSSIKPDNYMNQDCGVLSLTYNGTDDDFCASTKTFVCEYQQ